MSTPNFAACLSQSASYSNTNHSSNNGASSTAAAAAVVTGVATATNVITGSSSNGKRENSLSMDDIDNTTDSMSAVDCELTKLSPQMSKDGINTTTISEKSPPGSQSGLYFLLFLFFVFSLFLIQSQIHYDGSGKNIELF